MIYHQPKVTLYSVLIGAILAAIFGLIMMVLGREAYVSFLFLGITWIILFILHYRNRFIEISDERVRVGTNPKREIKIEDIRIIKCYAGDYIIKSKDKAIVFSKNGIAKKEREKFDLEFNDLKARVEAAQELKLIDEAELSVS